MKGKTTPLLVDCPEKNHFLAANGAVFKNYADLHDGLKRMDDETFQHHVSSAKNDFANWVLHVYSDDKLSEDFAARPERLAMAQNVSRRIQNLARRHI